MTEHTIEELQEYKEKLKNASIHDTHCVLLSYELVQDLIDEVVRHRQGE